MFNIEKFMKELETLINSNSVDNYCGMHDFVLAELLSEFVVRIAVANNRERELKNDEEIRKIMEQSSERMFGNSQEILLNVGTDGA